MIDCEENVERKNKLLSYGTTILGGLLLLPALFDYFASDGSLPEKQEKMKFGRYMFKNDYPSFAPNSCAYV